MSEPKNVTVPLTDGRPVRLELPQGYFYQVCVGCGMIHKVTVHDQPTVTLTFQNVPELPEEDCNPDLVVDLGEEGKDNE